MGDKTVEQLDTATLLLYSEKIDAELRSRNQMSVSAEEQDAWDSYFAEVTGWTHHPGYYRENATKPTVDQCADIADEMLAVRRRRIA